MSELTTRMRVKSIAAQRWLMTHLLSGPLRLFIVTEYPKSGGTWVAQIVGDYLDIPFPRNRAPRLGSCVMHGHYLYRPSLRNVLCVMRDGRDVMVSAYHHYLFQNERTQSQGTGYLVDAVRDRLGFQDVSDVSANLPTFIDFLFTERDVGPFRFRWDEFVRSWLDRDAPVVRYEDLLEGEVATLAPALQRLSGAPVDTDRLARAADRFSFERQTGRPRGVEAVGQFLRRGVAGGWREVFTPEARKRFDAHAGAMLIAAGYEPDRTWVAESN